MEGEAKHLRRRKPVSQPGVTDHSTRAGGNRIAEASASYHTGNNVKRVIREPMATLDPILTSMADLAEPVSPNLVDAMAGVVRVSGDPLHAAFLTRSINAVTRLARALSPRALGDAVGSGSDLTVLLEALEEPDALAVLEESDPLAEARLRDLAVRDTIVHSEGGVLTVDEVARQLGITRQAVDKRRRSGRILALPIGQHRYAYPAWQFCSTGMLDGFEDVLAEFSLPDPWTRAAFFLSENTLLDGSRPLDELRRGNVQAVRRAAWALGEQGSG